MITMESGPPQADKASDSGSEDRRFACPPMEEVLPPQP